MVKNKYNSRYSSSKEVCDTCGKSIVWARVKGKPYCATHYRTARARLKDEAVKDLIKNIESQMHRHPDLAKKIDVSLLKGAKDLYRDLKENTTVQAKPKPQEVPKKIKTIDRRMENLEQNMHRVLSFIERLDQDRDD